ncbi:hypothetical protein ACODM8_19555 [Vibrio ostreicida]|uniref:hypothetical protein n=1 Tax=Vibrio ostreicida TaxID=526588 RepID=UPI003B5B6851
MLATHHIKKTRLALSTVLVLALAAGGAYWLSQPQVDPEYQKRLDFIVESREFGRARAHAPKIPHWGIVFSIPENPPVEVWNTVLQQPQVMFSYGDDGDLYTMNLNGTDVRLLLSRKELGHIPYGGFTQRSANGRYLALHYFGLVGQNCAVFDLKTREVVAKLSKCLSATFSQDSATFYYSNRGPKKINLATRERLSVFDETFKVGDETYYPRANHHGFGIDEINDRYIWMAIDQAPSAVNEFGIYSQLTQFVFRLSDMSFIGKQAYLSEPCETGYTRGPVAEYLMCGDSKPYKLYSFTNPSHKLEEAPERYVLQRGQWYAKRSGNRLLRYRQPDEQGMFDGISYYYVMFTGEGPGDYWNPIKNNYYIPAAIRKDFKQYDLRPFFPPIPTQAEYDQSYQRQLRERQQAADRR